MHKRIEKIIREKQTQGLSVQQLSDMSRISASTISRTLSGKTDPTEYTIKTLEEALGLTNQMEEDPILARAADDPMLQRYLLMLEDRINRMRAHYNTLLAEKNRWIILSFALNIILVAFSCTVLAFDVIHPDIGWIRQRLGLGLEQFNNMLRSASDYLRTFV